MKMKSVVKYQISEYIKPVVIFYMILLAVTSLLYLLSRGAENSFVSFNGLESSSVIFLFVMGLVSFKESFRLFMQNGLSRKTMFSGYITALFPITVAMALFDRTTGVILSRLGTDGNYLYQDLVKILYNSRYIADSANIQLYLEGLLFCICLYLMIIAVGLFITVAYYRMTKYMKVAVSIGVPGILFVVLPILDGAVAGGAIFRFISNSISTLMGMNGQANPYIAMATFLAAFITLCCLIFLMMRKAVLKN